MGVVQANLDEASELVSSYACNHELSPPTEAYNELMPVMSYGPHLCLIYFIFNEVCYGAQYLISLK